MSMKMKCLKSSKNIILVSPTIYNNIIDNFKNQSGLRKAIDELNKKKLL